MAFYLSSNTVHLHSELNFKMKNIGGFYALVMPWAGGEQAPLFYTEDWDDLRGLESSLIFFAFLRLQSHTMHWLTARQELTHCEGRDTF